MLQEQPSQKLVNGVATSEDADVEKDSIVNALHDVRDAMRDMASEIRADFRGMRWDIKIGMSVVILVLAAALGLRFSVSSPVGSLETAPVTLPSAPIPVIEPALKPDPVSGEVVVPLPE